MADFRTAGSLGARIQAARKQRGFRTTRDLAQAINVGNVSESIIENIEAGRKVNVDISQLLNIAKALSVSPSFLLAPLGTPDAKVDLPNLSKDLSAMTALEFDAWAMGTNEGEYRPTTMDERTSVAELQALREWAALRKEIMRLETLVELEDTALENKPRSGRSRLEATMAEQGKVTAYLRSAGWEI